MIGLLGLTPPRSPSCLLGAIGVVLAVIAPGCWRATNIIFLKLISMQLPPGTAEQAVAMLSRPTRPSWRTSSAHDPHPGEGVDSSGCARPSPRAPHVGSASHRGQGRHQRDHGAHDVPPARVSRAQDQPTAAVLLRQGQRGDLISRVTNDIDNITQTSSSRCPALTAVLTVVGVIVMMFSIS